MRGPVVIFACGLAVALLAWQSIGINLTQCRITGDTPYLDFCPDPATNAAERVEALQQRIAWNPGDTNAYVQLMATNAGSMRLLDAAARLAPRNPNVLKHQALAAIDKQDWSGAVGPLLQLTEYHNDIPAAVVLARLVGAGKGNLLSAELRPGTHWFERVLAQMPQPDAPFSTALPLVVQSLKSGVIDVATVRGYIRQLKASAAWADAYSLWLSLNAKPLPTLYNGSFDQDFDADGFDWELIPPASAGKAGAIVERRGDELRGAVLDIRFSGRAMQVPLVRQHLFIAPGRYRLRGEYMGRQLRLEEGLAWRVVCSARTSEASRSSALFDTGGTWRPFTFEFTVSPQCGLVASLQLETFAPYESTLGARGRIAFDAFSLEKLPS
jgi:hypothetical protein